MRVEPTWIPMETVLLSQLAELQMEPPAARDLRWCGDLRLYRNEFDIVVAKKAKALEKTQRQSFFVSALDDPVIQELALSGQGNVFATDSVLSHIMACPRSVYPWDLVFTCVGDTIFIEPRDPFRFDLLTVNETAMTPPKEDDPDDINGEDQLCMEATAADLNFEQQVSWRAAKEKGGGLEQASRGRLAHV